MVSALACCGLALALTLPAAEAHSEQANDAPPTFTGRKATTPENWNPTSDYLVEPNAPLAWYVRGGKMVQGEGRVAHVVIGATAAKLWTNGNPWFDSIAPPRTDIATEVYSAVLGYDLARVGFSARWTWMESKGTWTLASGPSPETLHVHGPEVGIKLFRGLWAGSNLAAEGFFGFHNTRNSLSTIESRGVARVDVSDWGPVYGARLLFETPDLAMLLMGQQEIEGIGRTIVHMLLGPDVGIEVRIIEPNVALTQRLTMFGVTLQAGAF